VRHTAGLEWFMSEMKVQVHNWQGKANELIAALKRKGAKIVNQDPDVLLIDFDAAIPYYTKKIEVAYQKGAEIAMYSHGAPVITAYDRVWEPDERVSVYLAQSQGQKDVMRSYGYPHPIEVVGWHYCDIKKFKPVKEIKTILFAPWHPHGGGYLHGPLMQANADVYDRLRQTPYKIRVMHIGELRHNGLKHDPDVEYIESNKTTQHSVKEIDRADVVVGNYVGTFGALAVARGKPTVIYGQDIRPHDGYNDADISYVRNWERYRDLLYYPHDISDLKPKATQNMIEHAALYEAKEWRERFIGEPLDEAKLYEVLTGLLEVSDDE
jgi:hypothetical protein